MTTIKLATVINPLAARLISRYGLTDETIDRAKNCRKQWTAEQYQEYLLTEHWRMMRAKALLHYGRKCYLCGDKNPETQIDIHHNDYTRLGGEWIGDLIPLCHDCHERHHFDL